MVLCWPGGIFPCLWHYNNWSWAPPGEVFYLVSTGHVINGVSTLSAALIHFPSIPVSPFYVIEVFTLGNSSPCLRGTGTGGAVSPAWAPETPANGEWPGTELARASGYGDLLSPSLGATAGLLLSVALERA